MDGFARATLANRLYQRRNEAVHAERRRIEGDFQPAQNDCHRNVTLWCERNTNLSVVRGWLIADYTDVGIYKFFAHSVVQNESGYLIDITPNPLPWAYPFLRHDPADGDFGEIVDGFKITSLIYSG